MEADRKAGLIWGVILILAGLAFLAVQVFPRMFSWAGQFSWPWFVIGAGVVLLLIGVLTRQPGMAVPACIVGGIGCILYWQNMTGNWASWAWIWALIPGFAGLGTVIMGLWEWKPSVVLSGLGTMLFSIVLTLVFASFLGGPQLLGQYLKYWPVLLIAIGLISLAQYFTRLRRTA